MNELESSERLMELTSEGENTGYAIFDAQCCLIKFDEAFVSLYTNCSFSKETHYDTLVPCWDRPLQEGMTWLEILVRSGCRVPISLAPSTNTSNSPQEILLMHQSRRIWIRVVSWKNQDGTIVSVHSDISEIKERIRERRIRFQLSRIGRSFPAFNKGFHNRDAHRRASTGAYCQTIDESDNSASDTEEVSSKLSKSLPIEMRKSMAETPVMLAQEWCK